MSRKQPEIPIAARPVFSVNEVMALLGLSRATIYKLLNSGQLASVMIGGRRLFTREAVDALIAKASADARDQVAA
jgi:excisionase family DNA binding protein